MRTGGQTPRLRGRGRWTLLAAGLLLAGVRLAAAPPVLLPDPSIPTVAPTTPVTTPASAPASGWKPRTGSPSSPAPDGEQVIRVPVILPAQFKPISESDGPVLPPLSPIPPALRLPAAVPVNQLPKPKADDEPGTLPPPRKMLPDPPPEKLPIPRPAEPPTSPRSKAKPPPKPPSEMSLEQSILLGAARNAISAGDLDTGLRRFEEYLRRYPDDLQARREYAGVLVTAGRYRAAQEQYRQLIGKDPDDMALRVLLADLAVTTRDYRQAASVLMQVLEKEPDNLEAAVRLARAYALDGDLPRAARTFDRYLGQVRPGDEDVPDLLPALLIDLDRPRQALEFLADLKQQKKDDPEVQALIVRAWAKAGERGQAAEAIADLGRIAGKDTSVRFDLAEYLFSLEEFDLAGTVFSQVLMEVPNNQLALIGVARAQIAQYQLAAGRQTLAGFSPSNNLRRNYQLTWAEYFQRTGELAQAKQIYREQLQNDPADNESRNALAKIHESLRDFEKAKAEYSKSLAQNPSDRTARLGLVSVQIEARFFKPALDCLQAYMAQYPGDANAVVLMARALSRSHEHDRAEAVARGYLAVNQPFDSRTIPVGMALGRVLLDARKPLEAAHAFEAVLSRPRGRVAPVFYGSARAVLKLGDAPRARAILANVISPLGGDVRARLQIADEAATDFDEAMVIEMTNAVLKFDPTNQAALIRLAEAQMRVARQSGDIHEVEATIIKQLLPLSPTNIRGRMALARAYGIAQCYPKAVSEYNQVIAVDPEYVAPRRERARALWADHRYDEATGAYLSATSPPAEEQLYADLLAFAQQQPRVRQLVETCVTARLPAEVIKSELVRASSMAEPDLQAGMQRIMFDYEARAAEQEGYRAEAKAKDLKSLRDFAARPLYEAIIHAEPTNTEAWFDLGQIDGGHRFNQRELNVYGGLLDVDPVHREAMIASERSALETNPRWRGSYDYFYEKGRDGLATIQRMYWTNMGYIPIGDETEYVGMGYARALFIPQNDADLSGNLVYLVGQKRVSDHWHIYADTRYEQYATRIRDRVNYEIGGRYLGDYITGSLATYRNNVIENAESMRQDITRLGVQFTENTRFTRRWDTGGFYRFGYYSDDNVMHEGMAFSNVLLTYMPTQLKLIADIYYLSYSQQTVFGPLAPTGNLVGTVHPYFAPNGFAMYSGRIEWLHYVSRGFFVHSNNCYYLLQYGISWDNQFVNYHTFRARAAADLCPWLSIGIDSQLMLSKVYNMGQVIGYFELRSLQRYW